MKDCCQKSNNCGDHAGKMQDHEFKIALIGNPNCGKTTLFNALTGGFQRVGNWPGVTVEQKRGSFNQEGVVIEVIDLPGLYSLSPQLLALDEQLAADFILKKEADLMVNIIDASHLERHLYLTIQLREMGLPVILVLNMMDVANKQKLEISLPTLSQKLACPVLALSANKKTGIADLKKAIVTYQFNESPKLNLPYPHPLKKALAELALEINFQEKEKEKEKENANALALRLLEGDKVLAKEMLQKVIEKVKVHKAAIEVDLNEEADILLAETRYQFIKQILNEAVKTPAHKKANLTSKIDYFVLNRFLGLPIFLGVMYLLFVFAIKVGGAFQDFFDLSSQAFFVDGIAYLLAKLNAPTFATALLANGIGKGINTTITFIPVIGAMFLFLALLEDSGYMARAAFVIDRLMRFLGLPGKAFLPMIVGFGCNVPAVMAARNLENKRDRILTIMMSPFMSCGARLAIFAVFTAAFFPTGGENIVFALYLIGVIMALLTGFLLRRTVLKGDPAPFIMELPPYHLPQFKTVCLHALERLKAFVFRAGKIIVPLCVLIGALNALNLDGSLNQGAGDSQSLLSALGQLLTPIFAPMGLTSQNWPATVSLLTGVLAKEVVVGTLNTLYAQAGHLLLLNQVETFQLWGALKQALWSIPHNLAELGPSFLNPFSPEKLSLTEGVYGLMYQKFDGKIGAFAYLLFVLLYFPCVSTMAAMLRELNRAWSVFSALWMTGIAYGSAVLFYQAATFMRHPLSSSYWILGILFVFGCTFAMIHFFFIKEKELINEFA